MNFLNRKLAQTKNSKRNIFKVHIYIYSPRPLHQFQPIQPTTLGTQFPQLLSSPNTIKKITSRELLSLVLNFRHLRCFFPIRELGSVVMTTIADDVITNKLFSSKVTWKHMSIP